MRIFVVLLCAMAIGCTPKDLSLESSIAKTTDPIDSLPPSAPEVQPLYSLIKDINPGDPSTDFTPPTEMKKIIFCNQKIFRLFNDKILVTAENSNTHAEIELPDDTGSPQEPFCFQNRVFFSYETDVHGQEIWTSDGTQSGTSLWKDFLPGADGSYPTSFTVFNGSLYFVVRDPDTWPGSMRALYRTNGDSTDVQKIQTDWKFESLTVFGNYLYYVGDSQDGNGNSLIWRTDGSVVGTIMMIDDPSFPYTTILGEISGRLILFAGYSGNIGFWSTSGGEGDLTFLAEDKNIGGDGGPYNNIMSRSKNRIWFCTYADADADNDYEPKIMFTDGTVFGTEVVYTLPENQFCPKSHKGLWLENSTSILYMMPDGGGLYNLYRSSESAPGAIKLTNWDLPITEPWYIYYNYEALTADNGFLVLSYLDPTDGDGETYQVKALTVSGSNLGVQVLGQESSTSPIAVSSNGQDLDLDAIQFSNQVLFPWFSQATGVEYYSWSLGQSDYQIWHDEGSEPVEAPSSTPQAFLEMDDRVVFTATTLDEGFELWVTDGSEAGTRLLKDILPGPGWSFPRLLWASREQAFFYANDGTHGNELWVTDGTTEGTVLVKDINPGSGDSMTSAFQAVQIGNLDKIFFVPWVSGSGREPWVSDGTAAGTFQIDEIGSGSTDGASGFGFTRFQNKVLFPCGDYSNGYRVCITDGTAMGTEELAQMPTQSYLVGPSNFIEVSGGIAVFLFRESASKMGLWKTDGTIAGTSQYLSLDVPPEPANPIGSTSDPSGFYGDGVKAYFVVETVSYGYELWKTDGTALGTQIVHDLAPGNGQGFGGYISTPFGFPPFVYGRTDANVSSFSAFVLDSVTQNLIPFSLLPDGFSQTKRISSNLFSAPGYTEEIGVELLISDGTVSGSKVVDLFPGSTNSSAEILGFIGDQVILKAYHPNRGDELWKVSKSVLGLP